MKKALKGRHGEGYVEMCVGVVVFVMILVVAINIFSFIDLRIEMDRIADELLDTAAFSGCFGEEFQSRAGELLGEFPDAEVVCGADEYFNSAYKRVQLGHVMRVDVTVTTDLRGLGAFGIPVTLTVSRSGLSQRYWK